jgi:hypothetical protein
VVTALGKVVLFWEFEDIFTERVCEGSVQTFTDVIKSVWTGVDILGVEVASLRI